MLNFKIKKLKRLILNQNKFQICKIRRLCFMKKANNIFLNKIKQITLIHSNKIQIYSLSKKPSNILHSEIDSNIKRMKWKLSKNLKQNNKIQQRKNININQINFILKRLILVNRK